MAYVVSRRGRRRNCAPAWRVPVGAAASVWSVGLCGKMLVLNVPFTALEGDGAEGTAGARRAIVGSGEAEGLLHDILT